MTVTVIIFKKLLCIKQSSTVFGDDTHFLDKLDIPNDLNDFNLT